MPVAHDVLIIGGGVMGCASALALARKGVQTLVLERSIPGAEASSAAAGMLGAQVEAKEDGPFLRLCIESRARFGDWARSLQELTGIDVQHRRCGVLRVATREDRLSALTDLADWQSRAGLSAEPVDGKRAREIEPELAESIVGGVHFPDDARVDPPSLLKALRIAAERCGARFQTGALVRRVVVEGGRARGVLLEDGERVEAAHVVLAAGSWSTLVEGTELPPATVRPARGQVLELTMPRPVMRGILWGDAAYMSPRDDGRVLVGSTLEFVGFRRGVTAGAIRDLLGGAIGLVPALHAAELSRTWSAFRPYTADEMPLIGPTDVDGLTLATGHYRNGILLSPITGEIVTSCATGEAPPVSLEPFHRRSSPGR